MRAITYDRFGEAADVLTLEDLPTPDPAPGEVLVRLATSGANPSDVRARAGGRPGVPVPPWPKIIPHSDGAGTIEAVGDGIDAGRIGERVWIWNGQWQRPFGTAAEYIALPAEQAVRLPEVTSFEAGAAMGIPGLTAVHAVLGQGPVEGKVVLVSGGAGTVGRLAVQVAAAHGAEVIATARGDGIEAARTAGAHHVIDYTADDLADRIRAATQGRDVDHIVEVEFGENIATDAKVIAMNGTISAYGSAKAMSPVTPFYELMFRAVTLEHVLVYVLTPEKRARAIATVTDLLERQILDPRIADIMDLADCARAHDIIAAGGRAGSIILRT